jgi:hypothetical protein
MNGPVPKIVGFAWKEFAPQRSGALPPRFVLRLQQTVGNQAVVRLLAQPLVPADLGTKKPGRIAAFFTPWRRLLRKPSSTNGADTQVVAK